MVRVVLSLVAITSHSDLLEGGSSACRSYVWRWEGREVEGEECEVRDVR